MKSEEIKFIITSKNNKDEIIESHLDSIFQYFNLYYPELDNNEIIELIKSHLK